MQERSDFTLTSAVGDFYFPGPILMSHAKLIRDTIMGEVRSGEKIRPENAVDWFNTHVAGPAKHNLFHWTRK